MSHIRVTELTDALKNKGVDHMIAPDGSILIPKEQHKAHTESSVVREIISILRRDPSKKMVVNIEPGTFVPRGMKTVTIKTNSMVEGSWNLTAKELEELFTHSEYFPVDQTAHNIGTISMNTDNATKMTKALAQRGHESIVVASGSGDILVATAKAKLHAADKVRTILPSSAKFDGKKWATTYEGQYITDPAEVARLREEAGSNEETALRLGKIHGKGDAQEVFLKSGPVVEMDKKAISEYMKGLEKQDKARQQQADDTEKPKAPKVKQNEGEVGKKVARNVAKKEDPKVKQDEGEAGKKVARNVAKKEDPKTTEGKSIRAEAPKKAPKEAKASVATAGITKNNEGLTFRVKAPIECTDKELAAFVALVSEGNKVDTAGIESRVKSAALLGFVYKNKELVASAALKNPLDTYREKIEEQAGTELPKSQFPYEIGWIYVKPEFRNQAILQKLQMLLSNKAFRLHEGMFATTKEVNKANIAYLESSRFKKAGDTWISPRDGSPMVLYTREANASAAGFCGFYSLMAP